MTEQIPRRTQPDDGQQDTHQGLFRTPGHEAEDQPPAARSTATTVAAQPSSDLFSHASEHDVAEQQQPASHQDDDKAPRSFQLPFEAETDTADALDQQRSVPAEDDDYR